MGDIKDPDSWAKFTAMQRSHQWKVDRGNPQTKQCAACGDTNDSPIRYCPGAGAMPAVRTVRAEARIEVPPLEDPNQGQLFHYPSGGVPL